HGITTIRSTADPLPYIGLIRDRFERGDLLGPRLMITGPTPCSPDGHPATTVCRNNPFCRQGVTRELDSEEQARRVVRELVRANTDAVKFTLEDRFPPKVQLRSDALVAALVEETHRTGRRLIAHAPITKHFIDMGIDEFVHLWPDVGSAEAQQLSSLLVARNIPVTTTLAIGDGYRDAKGMERAIWGFPYS